MKPTDDLVREFHEHMELHIGRPGTLPDLDLIRFRLRLIKEEYEEVEAELTTLLAARRGTVDPQPALETLGSLLKEMCDLRYVLDGTAVSFGLPYAEAYREVHRSNMSKLGEDGKPVKDAGGKVMKGPWYSPADMQRFVPPLLEHFEDPEE